MKTNIWQLGQNQYTQDVWSLLFYLQYRGAIRRGCIAFNGFSSTIAEKFKDHKLLLMIFFLKSLLYNACFPAGPVLVPWQPPSPSEGCSRSTRGCATAQEQPSLFRALT